MTTPTEKWIWGIDYGGQDQTAVSIIRHDQGSSYTVVAALRGETACAVAELYDYAVQLERDNKALSVNAENLEIVRKQRDEYLDWYEDAFLWAEMYLEPRDGGPRHCPQVAGGGR